MDVLCIQGRAVIFFMHAREYCNILELMTKFSQSAPVFNGRSLTPIVIDLLKWRKCSTKLINMITCKLINECTL